MSHSAVYGIKRRVYTAAKSVFAELGPGLDKEAYIQAMHAEFNADPYAFAERGPALPVVYKGRRLGHTIRADFRIAGKCLVYVTAEGLVHGAVKQALYNRLLATGSGIGVVVNFNRDRVDCCGVSVEPVLPGRRGSGLVAPSGGETAVRGDEGRRDEGMEGRYE